MSRSLVLLGDRQKIGNLMKLVNRLVRQFAIAFNTLLSVTFHVVVPSFFPSQFCY